MLVFDVVVTTWQHCVTLQLLTLHYQDVSSLAQLYWMKSLLVAKKHNLFHVHAHFYSTPPTIRPNKNGVIGLYKGVGHFDHPHTTYHSLNLIPNLVV